MALYNNGTANSAAVTDLDVARQAYSSRVIPQRLVIANEPVVGDCFVIFGAGTLLDLDILSWSVSIQGGAIDTHAAAPNVANGTARNLKFDVGFSLDGNIYDTPGTISSGRLWEAGIDDIGFDAVGTVHRNKTSGCRNNCGLDMPLVLRVAALPMAGFQAAFVGKVIEMQVTIGNNVRAV